MDVWSAIQPLWEIGKEVGTFGLLILLAVDQVRKRPTPEPGDAMPVEQILVHLRQFAKDLARIEDDNANYHRAHEREASRRHEAILKAIETTRKSA